MNNFKLKILNKLSTKARIYSLMSIFFAGSGHPGGVLSCIDIILYIYLKKIKVDKLIRFKTSNRNRFILSKGHSVPAIYASLASLKVLNFKEIFSLRKINSIYQGHPCRINTPWVEASTGSLGQGFSFAIGQALALKYLKNSNKVFVMIGDGEMQEGQIWEGLLFAAHHKLNNFVTILDYNKLQSDNFNKNILNIEPLKQKLKSFNWNVIEINGHSFNQIEKSLNKKFKNSKPIFIIANTIKGKGVSFMENKPLWHGSVKMSLDQITSALKKLRAEQDLINMCKKL
jgi:transketolase